MGRKAQRRIRAHRFPLEHPSRSDTAAAGVERITEPATGARDGKPMLADGRVRDVRHVVWCTGFQGDDSGIEGLTYGEDGYPEQDHGVVTTAPGLDVVGLKFQRAGASSLVGGVSRDAKQIVDHIAAGGARPDEQLPNGTPHGGRRRCLSVRVSAPERRGEKRWASARPQLVADNGTC